MFFSFVSVYFLCISMHQRSYGMLWLHHCAHLATQAPWHSGLGWGHARGLVGLGLLHRWHSWSFIQNCWLSGIAIAGCHLQSVTQATWFSTAFSLFPRFGRHTQTFRPLSMISIVWESMIRLGSAWELSNSRNFPKHVQNTVTNTCKYNKWT